MQQLGRRNYIGLLQSNKVILLSSEFITGHYEARFVVRVRMRSEKILEVCVALGEGGKEGYKLFIHYKAD